MPEAGCFFFKIFFIYFVSQLLWVLATLTFDLEFRTKPFEEELIWTFSFRSLVIYSSYYYWWILWVIKKFSAWPSSVQNKVKIVFASYSSKAQNTTCTIWRMGYKYFVHFSGRRLFAYDMGKNEVTQCSEMSILTDSFVPLHALLFWLRIEVVDPRFILNNELWNKFLVGHVSIVREVFQKLMCSSGVSILDTHLTDTSFIRWNAQNIYSPKVALHISCSEPCYYKNQILF